MHKKDNCDEHFFNLTGIFWIAKIRFNTNVNE